MKVKVENLSFGEIIDALNKGETVKRASWHCNKVAVKQIPSHIPNNVIANMQSMPSSMKSIIRDKNLEYNNQCLIITLLETTASATSYIPTWNDIFANDWMIVENEF